MSQQQVIDQRIEDSRYVADDSYSPNRQVCFLCHRAILQHEDYGWWYLEDEDGFVPTHKSDFTNAFETQSGWCCGTTCWDNYHPEEL